MKAIQTGKCVFNQNDTGRYILIRLEPRSQQPPLIEMGRTPALWLVCLVFSRSQCTGGSPPHPHPAAFIPAHRAHPHVEAGGLHQETPVINAVCFANVPQLQVLGKGEMGQRGVRNCSGSKDTQR